MIAERGPSNVGRFESSKLGVILAVDLVIKPTRIRTDWDTVKLPDSRSFLDVHRGRKKLFQSRDSRSTFLNPLPTKADKTRRDEEVLPFLAAVSIAHWSKGVDSSSTSANCVDSIPRGGTSCSTGSTGVVLE